MSQKESSEILIWPVVGSDLSSEGISLSRGGLKLFSQINITQISCPTEDSQQKKKNLFHVYKVRKNRNQK